MATGTTTFGDISPRTAAHVTKDFLAVGLPYVVLEPFAQTVVIPQGKSKAVEFRRYKALSAIPAALGEGVTPSAKKLDSEDVTATLIQYGDRVVITDVVQDTHEDPVLKIANERLGEQAGEMLERVRFGVVKAGTNVFYANGSARTDVNTPLTLTLQRKVTRALKRQRAKKFTRILRSTPAYGTQNVEPSFIAIIHPDLESDVRGMTGFIAAKDYGQISPYPNEIGAVEDVRYLTTDLAEPWEDGGDAKAGSGTAMLSSSGTSADVYPVLYFARDAWGTVALRGYSTKNNDGKMAMVSPVQIMVVNPKPSDSDPLAQRGHAGWKTYATAVILNDLWMCRAEVAATD
jgi:N4-gp56 family major capsid protein